MHFCYESEKTVTGPICSRIVALYHRNSQFLNYNADYEVFALGHSCGISDRVLLSNVFDMENCIKVNLCYYAKEFNENDFIEKVQEVSRHFKPESKNGMREKIIPFNESVFLNNSIKITFP